MHAKPQTWIKAIVTLVVLAVYFGAQRIPLPTVLPANRLGSYSIVALGVQPLFSGFIIVEFAALLCPAWRPLRRGPPADRAKLRRASLILGMLLALFQAWVFTVGGVKMGGFDSGAGAQILTVIILVGGTAAVAILARVADREGFGSGFSVLVLAGAIGHIVGRMQNTLTAVRDQTLPSPALSNALFAIAVVAGATLWMFSSYRLPMGEDSPHPALVSRPACGVAPLTFAGRLGFFLLFARQVLHQRLVISPVVTVVLTILATFLFVCLFNPPDRIAQVWKALSPNPPEGITRLKPLLLESVLFIIVVVSVHEWLINRWPLGYFPSAAMIILATGAICDMVREWRANEAETDLTPVWEIHQVYAVAPTLRLLESEGIHAFARGLRLRTLLQFFGPYVPVQILVPAEKAGAAEALLQARWPQ